MYVQIFFPDGRQVAFIDLEKKNYRGSLLPGSEIRQSKTWAAIITVQEWAGGLFNIGHRLFEVFSKVRFSINENAGYRLEALLTGQTYISVNGDKKKFRAGEYRITDVPLFKALFKQNTSCNIFITHYSDDLLKQLGIEMTNQSPRRMPAMMVNLINEMLKNPYTHKLRDFYYENSVRELLFLHLTQSRLKLPGNLINENIADIYKADTLISSDLQQHYTIEQLARLINTNQLKLKAGFKKVFGMGVFERLVYHRMLHAKTLLESSEKSITEIANLAGYDTVAGFIHAFRKKFNLTPREWRINERESDNEASGKQNI